MARRKYGKRVTILLSLSFLLLFVILWSLFISGPNRIYEQEIAQAESKIKTEVEDIKGLTMHQFAYRTFQGYTESTLYWFDEAGDEIITKKIETLDYEKARTVATQDYGLEVESVQLGYGYDNPVYEIKGSDKLLLLDYDSFVRVYEREDQ